MANPRAAAKASYQGTRSWCPFRPSGTMRKTVHRINPRRRPADCSGKMSHPKVCGTSSKKITPVTGIAISSNSAIPPKGPCNMRERAGSSMNDSSDIVVPLDFAARCFFILPRGTKEKRVGDCTAPKRKSEPSHPDKFLFADLLFARVVLGGPDAHLFVKLHRAGMIGHREIGNCLCLLRPLLQEGVFGL